MRRRNLLADVLATSFLFSSCGLVSPDVAAITFDLPPRSYAFDTKMWNLPAGTFPKVPCGPGQIVTDCCAPPAPVPAPNCSATPLVCESQVCTLRFPVSVAQQMDLKQDVPALAKVQGQYLIDVFVSRISYSVTSSLNVDLPPVDLYVAPDGVTSPTDPSAQKFGTVPATPAMTSADGDVELSADVEQIFAPFAHDPAVPFNFIAATTVVIPSGSAIPNGSVAISVTGQVTATP
jgi:hypothetical protein